jgi:hypothetical protein
MAMSWNTLKEKINTMSEKELKDDVVFYNKDMEEFTKANNCAKLSYIDSPEDDGFEPIIEIDEYYIY